MADLPRNIDGTYSNKEPSAQTVARDGEAPVSVLEDGSLEPVYEAKAKMLNKAIQDVGMGRYQWQVGIDSSSTPLFSIKTPSIRQVHCLLTVWLHSLVSDRLTTLSSSSLSVSDGLWTTSGPS